VIYALVAGGAAYAVVVIAALIFRSQRDVARTECDQAKALFDGIKKERETALDMLRSERLHWQAVDAQRRAELGDLTRELETCQAPGQVLARLRRLSQTAGR